MTKLPRLNAYSSQTGYFETRYHTYLFFFSLPWILDRPCALAYLYGIARKIVMSDRGRENGGPKQVNGIDISIQRKGNKRWTFISRVVGRFKFGINDEGESFPSRVLSHIFRSRVEQSRSNRVLRLFLARSGEKKKKKRKIKPVPRNFHTFHRHFRDIFEIFFTAAVHSNCTDATVNTSSSGAPIPRVFPTFLP